MFELGINPEIVIVPLGLSLGLTYLVVAGAYFALTIRILTELWKQRKAWNLGKFLLISGFTVLTLSIYALAPLIVLAL